MINDPIMFIEEKTKIMLNDLIMFIEEKNKNNGNWSDHVYKREKRK